MVAAHNSKTIHGIEMNYGRIVENQTLITLRHHYAIMTS